MEFKSFTEQILFSTLLLEVPGDDGTTIGTGFLLKVDLAGTDKSLVLLVSNRHVLASGRSLTVSFHRRKGLSDEPDLGQVLRYRVQDFSRVYFDHPNQSVDLACLNISSVVSQLGQQIYFKCLEQGIFASFAEEELDIGQWVIFVGYPEGRYDRAHNLPVLRSGFIASHPKVDFSGVPEFLVDAQVFPGSSGSPVFMNLFEARLSFGQIITGGKLPYLFLGVVSATMVRHNRIEVLPTNVTLRSEEIIGLGLVFKATAVAELAGLVVEDYRRRQGQ